VIARVALAGVFAGVLAWCLARVLPVPAVERATLASLAFVPLWTGFALALLAWPGMHARAGQTRRELVGLHRRIGTALVVLAVVVLGSGVGALLEHRLETWQLARVDAPVPALAEQPLDAVLAALLTGEPALAEGELSLRPATHEQPWIQVDYFDAAREHQRIDFDPVTGRELGRGEAPLALLAELHRTLLLGPRLGEPLVALLGLGLALVLASGLATRRGWLRQARAALRGRAPRAPAIMHAHQWLGFTSLVPALGWALSGALLGASLLIVPIVGSAAYGGDRAALMRDVLAVERGPASVEPAPVPLLAGVAEQGCPWLADALPDARVDRFVVRTPGRASGRVRVDLRGTGPRERGSFTILADGTRGECRALPRAGLGLQGFWLAIVLHFGEWGGALVELAYLLLGVGLLALALLGGRLVVRRRLRSGEAAAAARMARALTGSGLGLALASACLLLLSRVPALARDELVARVVFVSVWALVLGWVWIGELRTRALELLVALALVVLAVPVVGVLLVEAPLGNVELALVLAAGLLALEHARIARASTIGRAPQP
jgi:uncharacterized iron-regulated membrane protein